MSAAGCRLLQRYQNVKGELEAQQNLERCRYDKYKVRPAAHERHNTHEARVAGKLIHVLKLFIYVTDASPECP